MRPYKTLIVFLGSSDLNTYLKYKAHGRTLTALLPVVYFQAAAAPMAVRPHCWPGTYLLEVLHLPLPLHS